MGELLDIDSIRRIEQAALAQCPAGTLMARAAEAVAEATAALARTLAPRRPIVALVGPGNNGDDALLAALRLREWGYRVRAFALAPDAEPSGDAREAWRQARANGLPLEPPSAMQAWLDADRSHASDSDEPIVIDGLFGIGLARPLAGDAARWCMQIAQVRWPVVAVDVPSGLDAGTGTPVGGPEAAAMRACATVTMIADKPGLHTGAALDLAGTVSVAPLGIDAALRAAALAGGARAGAWRLFGEAEAAACLPAPRAHDSNKGDYGSVLCFGGAPGMRGAVLLAARGAQSTGAGKVYVGTPTGEVFDPAQPQLMTLAADSSFARFAVVAIGCGLGDSPQASAAVARALREARALVVDADALNRIASDASLARALAERDPGVACVITPHPLEAARLLGCDVRSVQADRRAAARALASRLHAVALLKGAGTIVATPEGDGSILDAGGPALASAGTGDVLAGVIAALLGRGLDAVAAACLGAWLHGRAAQRWTASTGHDEGLSAAELPLLVRETLATLVRKEANR